MEICRLLSFGDCETFEIFTLFSFLRLSRFKNLQDLVYSKVWRLSRCVDINDLKKLMMWGLSTFGDL